MCPSINSPGFERGPSNKYQTNGEIAQRIHLIRGQRVVLDTDLAAFYGKTTKRFNQQVNRNLNRFPAGFMFQLNEQEFANKVNTLERKVSVHERNIAELVDSMAELLAVPSSPPKRSIGFVTHEDKKG